MEYVIFFSNNFIFLLIAEIKIHGSSGITEGDQLNIIGGKIDRFLTLFFLLRALLFLITIFFFQISGCQLVPITRQRDNSAHMLLTLQKHVAVHVKVFFLCMCVAAPSLLLFPFSSFSLDRPSRGCTRSRQHWLITCDNKSATEARRSPPRYIFLGDMFDVFVIAEMTSLSLLRIFHTTTTTTTKTSTTFTQLMFTPPLSS